MNITSRAVTFSVPSAINSTGRVRVSAGGLRRLRASVVLCVLVGFASWTGQAQQQKSPELFTLIPNNKNLDFSAGLSLRVARLKSIPTTGSIRFIRINQDALTGDQVSISIPGTKSFDLASSGPQKANAEYFAWIGKPHGQQRTGSTLVARNGEITGSITTPEGLYRIVPLGDRLHALVQVNSSKFPKDEPESFRATEAQQSKSMPPALPSERDKKADTGPAQIDVLVAYTPAAKSAVNDIDATIALAVAEANQSYVNSGIGIHLNLVDSFGVSYSEKGKSFETILHDFVDMKDVNDRRDRAGADLATLIINQSDYCGLADAIMANAATAFAIVHYDCATGYYSFAHELGHLMGARHNEQADTSGPPFTYGHGYLHNGPPSSWRTIMAYDCPTHCQRLQYWSNPNINYGTEPMGTVATNDNARVLNQTAATVASFRTRPSP